MATPPSKADPPKVEDFLEVNPSAKEVWWENFAALKEHYNKHGNLTVRDVRLAGWLTYQRHEATTLNEGQLEALQSIGYMSTNLYREIDEKRWETKFNAVKANPRTKESHLVNWLHRQRKLAATDKLSSTRKQRLLEIGVDLQKKNLNSRKVKVDANSVNETRWMAKYNKLKQYGDKIGNVDVPRRYKDDRRLGNWVFNQRKRYHELLPNGDRALRKDRIELLEKIGFKWEVNRRIGKSKVERETNSVNTTTTTKTTTTTTTTATTKTTTTTTTTTTTFDFHSSSSSPSSSS